MDEVEKLIEQLSDSDLVTTNRAMNALVKIGAPAVPALIALMKMDNEALNDKDEAKEVRANIVLALGQIKDIRAIPALFESLMHGSSWVQGRAAGALAKIGKPAIPALLKALKNGDNNIRCYAAWAGLSQIKDASAVPALVKVFGDKVADARLAAAEALGKFGNIVKKYETMAEINEFETYLQEGLNQAKLHLKKNEIAELEIVVSKLRIAATKKKDELAQDKGILLTDIPKPPKKGTIYQSLRRVRNG